MKGTLFPDSIRPYLDEIAERLWSGHAAVMVGAGFSKNAEPYSTARSNFPDWAQLGDLFYQKVHGRKPNTQVKYLNILKLADEVHAALGRPALDQILREAIQDSNFEPSPLHVKLLDLPWSDVFTTNYDTLLERACATVSSQRYDVIVNKEDLVYSEKPRIVKLHGSFPSERPFVITEEDYRRYPKDYAPFVNTVQQSLLENTLCLIGFSGDDPNFLQWIGWIRDNLGKQNSPKIYLIGLFHQSDAQKKLFEQRNIVLVDISRQHRVEREYYYAFEQFLDYLSSKKAHYNKLEWPKEDENLIEPDIDRKTGKKEQLIRLLSAWKKQRLSYPGWVIAPDDSRRKLWSHTKNWVDFLSPEDELTDLIALKFAYEMNWRMEKCLSPPFLEQIAFFELIIEKFSPLSHAETTAVLPNLSLGEMSLYGLNQADIKVMTRHIMLWMLRFYREEGRLEKWKGLYTRIAEHETSLSPEQKANFYYEQALFSLFELNIVEVKKQLTEWPLNKSLPFWEAKKAGLLAEIGQVEQASKILKTSLADIRHRLNLQPVTSDYSLVSQESIVMLLLRYVDMSLAIMEADWSKLQEIQNEYLERWFTLKQYKCDPWAELKIFESSLERPNVTASRQTEKRAFDIGHITKKINMDFWDMEAWIAYNFLHFCEDAGLPFRIPGCSFGRKSAEGTLSRISEDSSYWAAATLVRIGDIKSVDHLFNRAYLSKMEIASVDTLVEQYLKSLEQSSTDIRSGNSFHNYNFGIVLAETVPEILSRLCCKCSQNAREKIFNFLLEIYQSNHRGNYKGIRNLTKRLMEAFSDHQRYKLLPRLLDFYIPDYMAPGEMHEFINPFEFFNIDKELHKNLDKPTISGKKIDALLKIAASSDANHRKWTTLSLAELHKYEFLSGKQINRFADVLWSQLDEDGLPSNTHYYKFAFLIMPHPKNVEPAALLKHYISRKQFPIQATSQENGISFTEGRIPLCKDIVDVSAYIDWSDEDVNEIFERLIKWWDADKRFLTIEDSSSPWGSIANEFRARFKNLVNILVVVIKPSFSLSAENNLRKTLSRLISELQTYGIPALSLESACLNIYPERKEDVFKRICHAMTSSNQEEVIDCLKAILIIVERTDENIDISIILASLGQMVLWQRETSLPNALNTITTIVNKYSQVFNGELERSTLTGLNAMTSSTYTCVDDGEILEKLPIRKAAAKLAFSLSEYYTKQGKTVPDVVREWETICQLDNEFAEIRNQWIH